MGATASVLIARGLVVKRRTILGESLTAACFLAVLTGWPLMLSADWDVPLGSWVYRDLDRLAAEGLIESNALDSRPISRRAAAELVLEAQGLAIQRKEHRFDETIERLTKEFECEISDIRAGTRTSYVRPIDRMRLGYFFVEGVPDIFNDRGRVYHEQSNALLDVSGGFQKGRLSGFIMWEGRWLNKTDVEEEKFGGRIEEGYLRMKSGKFFTEVGRESLWWGPGRHGALLLSDNAFPFDVVRIGNDEPFMLPGLFSHLGLISLEAFWTELEDDRDFPDANLLGMRLNLKLTADVDVGILRTAMFGGKGRAVTWDTIWEVLSGQSENDPGGPGNQLASVYWRWRFPFDAQPLEFYGEWGGEDQADPLYFTKQAILSGLYFPRIGYSKSFDLRLEYADTYLGGHEGNPMVWYNHGVYTDGYTYEGRVIGHHAGTDARDYYIELGWFPVDSVRLSFSWDYEERMLSQPFPEEHTELAVGMEWHQSEDIVFEGTYMFERTDNAGFVSGAEESASRLNIAVEYKF